MFEYANGSSRVTVGLAQRAEDFLNHLTSRFELGKTDRVERAASLYQLVKEAEPRGGRLLTSQADATYEAVRLWCSPANPGS
mgnify:CR=1 FL=1